MTPGTDPIHKVTIIPRGRALGVTQQLPLDDRHTYSKDYLLAQIAVLMGGRAAEEIFLDHMTTGAGNDIQRATDLARKMVCEWGMSELLGPLSFGQKEEQIFLGKEFARHRDYSEQTALTVDQEIRRLVADNYEHARKILEDNRDTLVRLAEALLERETLGGPEIDALMEGRDLPPLEKSSDPRKGAQPFEPTPPDERKVMVTPRPGAPDPEKV
jgi:cell division protease FtsH